MVPIDALEVGGELVPTAGSWERDGGAAHFTPRFPAVAGTIFVVLGRADARESWRELTRVVAPGAHPVSTTRVESIDPQVEEVPANLLRFTVTFSNPMEEGTATGRIGLRDANDFDLPGTLLNMPPELWDRDRRRLTVILEPGRIKRGLQPNVQAGPPLREGDTVSVVVGSGIRDAAGAELAAGAMRSYRVGAAVRSRVDPSRWDVQWPEGEHEPLVIRFDRPLDRALARRCLRVMDAGSQPVPGRSVLDESSSVWSFIPAARGERDAAVGDHEHASNWTVHIDTRLEDLAGNSVRRVFDRDLGRADEDGIDASLVILGRDGGLELKR
jgi:hypothetical protein